MISTLGVAFQQVAAEGVVQLGRRYRPVDSPSHEKVTHVRVRFEEYCRWEEHVVDPDDALFVELDVIDEGRSAVKREVQRVMKIVVEVGAGADQEVHQPSFHQLDHAPAKTRRGQSAGDGQRDGRVMLRQEHLVGENAAGLAESRCIEGLKPFFDEVPDVGASARSIVPNGFAGQVIGA